MPTPPRILFNTRKIETAPHNTTTAMADKASQGGKIMWPSEAWAVWLYDAANIALIVGLVIGVAATVLIVWMSNVKEAYLKRDLATTNERAEKSHERATNLEIDLERERTARLQLEETVSPRRIKPEEKAALINEFGRFSGRIVSVVSYAMDAESVSLGLEVIETLKGAGVSVIEGLLTQQPMSGIAVGLHAVGRDRALAHSLAAAFGEKTPLTVTYNPTSIPGFEIKAVLGGFDDSKAEATILIGPKPIPKAK